VHKGATFREVICDLEKKGIIANKTPLLLWNRLSGHGTKIKAGEYRLNSGMAPLGVLNILSKGVSITHPVTIPEGFTIKQIAEELEKERAGRQGQILSSCRGSGYCQELRYIWLQP